MRYPTIFEDDIEVRLPFKWAICSTCRGNGKHSARLGAMTPEYMQEQGEEFIEDYFAGNYDTTCETCDGSGKVPVVDRTRMTPLQKRAWREVEIEMGQLRSDERSEYRMTPDYLADLRGGM